MVLVRDLEDLGGGPEALGLAIAEIASRGAHVVVAGCPVDTRTTEGRAAADLAIRLARLGEGEARRRRTEQTRRRRENLQAFGRAPFGFRASKGKLVGVPAELRIVRRIIEMRERGCARHRRGCTDTQIARHLAEQAAGGRAWSKMAVWRIRTKNRDLYERAVGEVG